MQSDRPLVCIDPDDLDDDRWLTLALIKPENKHEITMNTVIDYLDYHENHF